MYHYEKSALIKAKPEEIFAYADDFGNFSSHMNKSTWMMGGGKMETNTDEGHGKKVGSHVKMSGKIAGIHLYLDEVITIHDPPRKKEWKTTGNINLIVIDHYILGFEISPKEQDSLIKVYIDYLLPRSYKTYILGLLLGGWYAKWCVNQIVNGVKSYFK